MFVSAFILSVLAGSARAVHVSAGQLGLSVAPAGVSAEGEHRHGDEAALTRTSSDTLAETARLSDAPTQHQATPSMFKLKTTAILRSLVAGLSTSLGAAIVLLQRSSPTASHMAFALALAAGVMLTVSLVELFIPPILKGEARMQALLSGLMGFLSFLVLRKVVPEPEMSPGKKDEELHRDAELGSDLDNLGVDGKSRQWRLALLMMVALTAHNFPEGLAVGVSSLQSEHLGIVVMAAIAVHNIPEGIAIAMPVLDATNSRTQAMLMATASGLAEPLGALLAVTVLPQGALTGTGMDVLLCVVGGIMTSVACIELLPEAMEQQKPMSTALGLLTGIAVMLLTHELA